VTSPSTNAGKMPVFKMVLDGRRFRKMPAANVVSSLCTKTT
jgi:hypothetical protein